VTIQEATQSTGLVVPWPNARKAERAEAAFRRSAVSLPTEAARAADHPVGIGPKDAAFPIGIQKWFLMARLGAEVNGWGGTPTKRASAILAGRPGSRRLRRFRGPARALCPTRDGAASDARGAGGADGRRGPLVPDREATRLGHASRCRDRTGGGVDSEGGAKSAGPPAFALRMQVILLRCPRCGEPMRRIAFVTDRGSITLTGESRNYKADKDRVPGSSARATAGWT